MSRRELETALSGFSFYTQQHRVPRYQMEPAFKNPPSDASVLLAIPAYRESARLPPFLKALLDELRIRAPHVRVVICDDGSGIAEQQRLRERLNEIASPLLLPAINLEQNVGKGGAILAAWDAHPGYEVYGFVDADGAVPPYEVTRLITQLVPGEASFGSRVRMMGRKVDRSPLRHAMGRIFNNTVEMLVEPDLYDSQCGLKFVPGSALGSIRHWLKGRRFAFDVELVAALRVKGIPVHEVPIDWQHIHGSKVSFFRDVWRMLLSVALIRYEMKQWRREVATPTQ